MPKSVKQKPGLDKSRNQQNVYLLNNNTPIVMIAGWAHGTEAWQPARDCLPADAAVHVLTLHDLLNTASDSPGAALTDFLEKLSAPAVLAGWSVGGMAALEAAARRPNLVKHLVLTSATARFCDAHDYACGTPLVQLRALRRKLQRQPESALRDFYVMAHAPDNIEQDELTAYVNTAMKSGMELLTAGLNYMEHTDLRNTLANINIPARIIHGRHDQIIPWQAGAYLAKHIPGAKSQMLNEGHALPYRRARELAELMQTCKHY